MQALIMITPLRQRLDTYSQLGAAAIGRTAIIDDLATTMTSDRIIT
jgi:hypothetical protein